MFLEDVKHNQIIPVIQLEKLIACGQYGTYGQAIHKMGYNPSISGTTQEDVWTFGGSYVFPPAATYPGAKLEVISDSAQDKGTATVGTGAHTVKIGYLDGSGVQKSEVVTLNGTGAVTTAAEDIWRINSFRVASAGTGLKAAGNITLQELDDAPVFSAIAAGQTRARNMAFTVPAGFTLMIQSISCSSAAASIDKSFLKFTLRGNVNEGVRTAVGLDYPLWENACAGNGIQQHFDEPIYIPALVDLHVVAVGNSASDAASAYCAWRGCLIAD